jgi:hypothetical protein
VFGGLVDEGLETFEAPLPTKVYFDYREETVSRPAERADETPSTRRG